MKRNNCWRNGDFVVESLEKKYRKYELRQLCPYNDILIWLPLLMRLMTCLCPATNKGLGAPLNRHRVPCLCILVCILCKMSCIRRISFSTWMRRRVSVTTRRLSKFDLHFVQWSGSFNVDL